MNTPECRAVFIQSQATSAMIEAMGMQAENEQRKINGESLAYREEHFVELINKYGLGHNSVITFLQQ